MTVKGVKNALIVSFLDFAKAFDSVDRSKLLRILDIFGVKGCSNRLSRFV